MSAGSPLFNMMAEMAKDEDLANDFKNDPAQVMDDFGVAGSQKDLILRAIDENRQILSATAVDAEAAAFWPQVQQISFTGL